MIPGRSHLIGIIGDMDIPGAKQGLRQNRLLQDLQRFRA